MSTVLYFTVEDRLSKIINAPGGKHVATAVADAEAQLAEVSDQCRVQVDAALDRVYRLSTGVPTGADLSALYLDVREIAGLAALCGLTDLGNAALSFCTLLDHAQNGGRLTEEQMRVHPNVLRVLRNPELFDQTDKADVLESLDAMVEKLASKDGAKDIAPGVAWNSAGDGVKSG